ncbi:MAG TPA: hypothetical protein VF175_15380 [Lacipirellula sp.]
MKRHVNLMTETARFRVGATMLTRRWALALAATIVLLAPLTIWRWQECRRIRQEHDALEATYEPFRRLELMNAELRTTATTLVRDERLPLELSRNRPTATLMGVVAAAVKATDGALYVEHLDVAQTPPGGDAAATPDRLLIDAVSTPQFDISTFTDALKRRPICKVKITSEDLITENGVDAKNYAIECLLTGPAAPKAADVK